MKKAMYPGSFDPVTNGHLDILNRACQVFDEITVVVSGTGHKQPLFSAQERVDILKETLQDMPNVKVDQWSGLIVEYAQSKQIPVIIRGLRAASDFEYEFMMASMNKQMGPAIETLFMMTSKDLFFVSSSMLKELYRYGGDIGPYVPEEVMERLTGRSGGAL